MTATRTSHLAALLLDGRVLMIGGGMTTAETYEPAAGVFTATAQYVGRLHRDHDGKREVIVYDYVDTAVPVLARMAAKREKGYKALGYVLES